MIEAVSIYFLLFEEHIVYIGIGVRPEDRVLSHWRKGYIFDDITEDPDGPYERAFASKREKFLIRKYRPIYNMTHCRKERMGPIREFVEWAGPI
jgi:hypothetical protein